MKKFIADLHIHTCLSPCAELDMTPRRIIERAIEKGLDIVAISDHNSAENAGIAIKIARERGILALPAMELTSYEEAHVLAMFGSIENALAMQDIVYRDLPQGTVNKRSPGYQLVVNEKDEIMEFNKRLFLSATGLPVKSLVDTVHSLGGLAVACHIDREYFSVISQLGFIPADVEFDALEISCNTSRDQAAILYREYASTPWITSSDAHRLDDIGKSTASYLLNEPSFDEIARALKENSGIEWETPRNFLKTG